MWFRTLFDSMKRASSPPPVQHPRPGPSRRRPAACRLSVEALEDRLVPASLWVSDVMLTEGNAGSQNAVVMVSLDAPSTKTVKVNYNTAAGTASAGNDYDAVSGKLTFAPGETSKSILIPVRGDRLLEPNETFFVKLHGASNATIAIARGIVTIVDDEPRLSISDPGAAEGNSGTTLLAFTVSFAAAYDQAVTVNFATQDGRAPGYGTAIAGQDYLATSGTLTFAPGETTKTFSVEVLGDTTPEPWETFSVNLSGASANALVIDGQGYGYISDDDGWTPTPYEQQPEPFDGTNTYAPASVSY